MKAKYTFAEFADVWFERHQQEIEEVTVERYTYILRTIKEHIGRRPLAEITTPEIEDFLQKLRSKKYLDSYIRSCRGMLPQIYNRALYSFASKTFPLTSNSKFWFVSSLRYCRILFFAWRLLPSR